MLCKFGTFKIICYLCIRNDSHFVCFTSIVLIVLTDLRDLKVLINFKQ